jgi:2'-5' RNA ligase
MSDSRLFFAAMLSPETVAAICALLEQHGLDRWLGAALFAPANWHQSLSERVFNATRADIALLRGVGERIRAHACTLQFNRIDSSVNPKGRVHVTLRARGRPQAFLALNDAVQTELRAADYASIATGVTPHTTLSYDAPGRIETIAIEPPLHWTIDTLSLVLGHGNPYRYEVLDRWPLLPECNPVAVQAHLF